MSKQVKIIVSIIVLIILIAVCYSLSKSSRVSNTNNSPVVSHGTVINTNTKLTSSASDSSDAALQIDAAALDAQLQGLNNDSASINQSVNAAQ